MDRRIRTRLALLAASVFIAWLQAEGEEFSSANLAMVPAYALGKVGIYCRIVIGRQLEWVRTKRD